MAADFARAMVNQLGEDDLNPNLGPTERDLRMAAIMGAASKLGLERVVEVLYFEPVPRNAMKGRIVPVSGSEKAKKDEEELRRLARELSILAVVDQDVVETRGLGYGYDGRPHFEMDAWQGQSPETVFTDYDEV